MKIFNLPDLGEGLTEAEIHEWHIKEGDEVKLDQTIVSMETAKAVVDVPSPRSGRVIKLFGKVGAVIATGSPLIEFEEGEETKRPDAGTVAGRLQESNAILSENPMGVVPVKRETSIKALPAVRMLAARLHVDLSQLKGTGPAGQIMVQDVENAAKKPPIEGLEPLKGVRKAMAQAMIQSHQEVVPVTLVDDADIHAWEKTTDITVRIIRAIIAACKEEPALNAYFDGRTLSRKLVNEINLGIALDSKEGLFVPVIKHCDHYQDKELRTKIDLFKQQARDRTIPQEELHGATITLSNFGVFAGRYASPIIVPPMVSIIAIGKLYESVVKVNDHIESHRMMPISLTFDHRAVTGGEAARFLQMLIHCLEK